MAGKKSQAPAKYEEPDEVETWEESDVAANDKEPEAELRLRDWRDVERYREIKELRKLVDEDDYAALEAIFPKPARVIDPRVTGRPRTKPVARPAPAPVAAKPAAKPVPATKPAPAAKAPPAAKPAPGSKAASKPVAAAAKPAPAKLAAKEKGLLAKMVARLTGPAKTAPRKAASRKPVAKKAAKPAARARKKKR